MKAGRRWATPPLRMVVRHRPRLSWLRALMLVAGVSAAGVVVSSALVMMTDPDRFPDFGTGLWWAVATVTTVGYGDVVPSSAAGRLLGCALMFVGIGCFAFLTAVAASAIVVGEVGEEEEQIERTERDIVRTQKAILARLVELDTRLAHFEGTERHAGWTTTPRSAEPG
jgi:voltage-gated potassium channel